MRYWQDSVRRWIKDPRYDTDALARQYMIFIATVTPWIRLASPEARQRLLDENAKRVGTKPRRSEMLFNLRERVGSIEAENIALAIDPALIVEWHRNESKTDSGL